MNRNHFIGLILGFAVCMAISSCGTAPAAEIPPTSPASPTGIPPITSPAPATEEPAATLPFEETPLASPLPSATLFAEEPQPSAAPQLAAGTNLSLDSIHMVTDTTGWAISGPYILTTVDGGNTWKEASPPESLPANSLAQAYGAFPDEQTAWVVYGFDQSGATDAAYAMFQIAPTASVWSTHDGGRTWTPSPALDHQAIGDWTWAEFSTLDASTGWMMVRGVYLGAGTHYNAQFFRTIDGGLTWQPIAGGDIGVDYTGLTFSDENNGWLTWQSTGAYAAAPPDYAVTGDGGDNWEQGEPTPPTDAPDLFTQYDYCEPYQPKLISAESIKMIVSCYDYYTPPHEYVGYLYSSADGGRSWTPLPLPKKVVGNNSTMIYFDEMNFLLLGREMYSSDDGGATWNFIKTVNWDGQFSFVDNQTGWAIATNENHEKALVHTVNGGKSWSQIEPVIAP